MDIQSFLHQLLEERDACKDDRRFHELTKKIAPVRGWLHQPISRDGERPSAPPLIP
jgi:hypothetical protein